MAQYIDKSAQRALEAYPVEMYEKVGWRCIDKNANKRQYFIEGYHQAEKDLELTYDDICEIMEIREDVLEMSSYENLYEEILKRFKDFKERKEKCQ